MPRELLRSPPWLRMSENFGQRMARLVPREARAERKKGVRKVEQQRRFVGVEA